MSARTDARQWHVAGLTAKSFGEHVTVAFAKVAEYQRRDVVHFHAIVRLDAICRRRPSPG